MTRLGDHLKVLRGDAPLQEIAQALEVNTSVISKYERGKRVPIPEIMRKLANYYSVNYGELQALHYQDQLEKYLLDEEARPYFEDWLRKRLKK